MFLIGSGVYQSGSNGWQMNRESKEVEKKSRTVFNEKTVWRHTNGGMFSTGFWSICKVTTIWSMSANTF